MDTLAEIGTLEQSLPVEAIFPCLYNRGIKGKMHATERTCVISKYHVVIGILSADKKTLQWDYAIDKKTFERMITRGIIEVLDN